MTDLHNYMAHTSFHLCKAPKRSSALLITVQIICPFKEHPIVARYILLWTHLLCGLSATVTLQHCIQPPESTVLKVCCNMPCCAMLCCALCRP
jgi:hypothetical protein